MHVMAVLAPSAPVIGPNPGAYHPTAMVARRRGLAVDSVVRLASLGALAFSVAIPLVVLLYFATDPADSRHFPEALVATAVYLPLHVRHVRYGLRGAPPPGLPWTLLAMAIVIIAPTPLLGAYWLFAFHALAASLLVSLRPRVSFPALALILLAVGIWGHHFGSKVGAAEYVYLPAAVLDRAMTVFVLVWLVGALRRIQAARLALADEALEAERRRVDDELRATVGALLEDVVRHGDDALQTMGLDVREAPEELESLVEQSRRALAETRRLVGRYKLVPARLELENAASLLRAAGMQAIVDVADEELPPALDESLRSSLRAAVARSLADGANGPVALRIGHHDGAATLEVLPASKTEPSA